MKKFFALVAIVLGLLCASRIASSQDAVSSLEEKLERERLAGLPALKAQLEDQKLRERADLIIVLNEKFFDKMLAELTSTKFDAAGLFSVTIHNPRVTLKNGLALARLEAQLQPANQLMNITSTLKVTARILVERGPQETLVAKLQVVDLQPSESTAPVAFSSDQLTALLPPLTLPLQFDFDQTIELGTVKQTKPIGLEIIAEPRRIRGRFEVIEMLPLEGRLAVLARSRNLSVQ